MEVIPFDVFMAINSHTYSIADAYWVIGGTGLAAIGLFWLESKGLVRVNSNWVKYMFVLVYAILIAKFIVQGKFWNLL